MLATAEREGVSGESLQGLEQALGPVETAWEIGRQIGRCLEMMEAFNIPVYSAPGFEADDVIGTLAVQAAEAGIDTYLVTLDSDLIQLIQPNVTVYMLRPYQRDHVIYDEAAARERYGFDPERMIDFKALRGDTSDNIPGVPGIGDGTATKLLVPFGSIEGIYEHIDEVKPDKLRESLRSLEAQVRQAKRWRRSASTCRTSSSTWRRRSVGRYDRQRVLDLLRDLEFRTLVPRLPPVDEDYQRRRPAAADLAGREDLQRSSTRRPTSTRWSSACARPGASPTTSRWWAAARTTACSSASPSPSRRARRTTSRSATSRRSAARSSSSRTSCWSAWRRCSPTATSRRRRTTASSTSPTSPAAASTSTASPSIRCSPPTSSAKAPWATARTRAPARSASSGSSRAASASR